MVSTFHGLEVAKRALNTQQSALYTTTHNISNANTEGYTRQRVNFDQVSTLTGARNADGINANIGSGVQAGSIERIRDQFLDVQYRKENGKSGYFEQRAGAMSQMESIMNEPSEQGLSHTMNQFWDSLQDLAINPEDSGARSVVSQRAQAVVDTFNYASTSLEAVRADLKSQIDVTTTEFNSIVTQINNVNQQIGGVEPHGNVPNDLYDERDRLIDRLSAMADVSVSYQKSSGQPSDIAMGKATITLNGVGKDITLVDGATYQQKNMSIDYDADNNIESYNFDVPGTSVDTQTVNAAAFKSTGELSGLMEMSGFIDGDEGAGYYNKMLDNLDLMAETFMNEFNSIHKEGTDLNGDDGVDFFTLTGTDGVRLAADFQVNQAIIDNPELIAASSDGNSGDGANAVKLTEAYTNMGVGLGDKTSVKSFYQSIIGEMGVVTQEANRMVDNAQILRQQVQRNRDSVSSVSLDEEMTNLIKFQHAYNAAARSMTAVDEMLDRIINNMGLVGR